MFCARLFVVKPPGCSQPARRCLHSTASGAYRVKGARLLTAAPKKQLPSASVPIDVGDGSNIAKQLEDHFNNVATKVADKHRVSVTSNELCDDVLQRLGPTLKKHKGCDIIDINPGVGLFSRRLHERLQPRKHILLEPETNLFRPFLQPLLDEPDSKWRLVEKSGLLWDNLTAILTPEHLPHQVPYTRNEKALSEPNDTLLVVANLGLIKPRSYGGHESVALLVLNQMINAMATRSLFNRYGLVRMLVWIDDNEKSVILPRAVVDRKRASIEAELVTDKIHEVAGAREYSARSERVHDLDIKSAKRALKRMADRKMKTPPHRIGLLEDEIVNKVVDVSEVEQAGRNLDTTRGWSIEYAELLNQFKNKKFVSAWLPDGTPYYGVSERERLPNGSLVSEKLLRLRQLRARMNTFSKRGGQIDQLIEEYDDIHSLGSELQSANVPLDGPEKKEFDQKCADFFLSIEKLAINSTTSFFQRLDDHRSLKLDPPTLAWDRRDYEPLAVKQDEFFPQKKLALLDIQPRTMWPVLAQRGVEERLVIEFLLSTLFMFPSMPLTQNLSSMAPGALEYLLENCPSLKNPATGGEPYLWMDYSARTVTQPMIKEILEAWMRWPFRPTTSEMMTRMGLTGMRGQNEYDDDIMGGAMGAP